MNVIDRVDRIIADTEEHIIFDLGKWGLITVPKTTIFPNWPWQTEEQVANCKRIMEKKIKRVESTTKYSSRDFLYSL